MVEPITRYAAIVTVIEEEGEYFLVIGEGDHSCDRWRLTESLLHKLAHEAIDLVLTR